MKSVTALCAALVLLVAAPSGGASTTLSDADLARAADVILSGQVVEVAAGWDADTIYTYVTIQVNDVVKGWLPERRVTLKQLGGRVGDLALVIDDQAAFTRGEDVVVFLSVRPRDRTLMTTALSQGKWTIARDAQSGDRLATRQLRVDGSQAALGVAEARSLSALLDAGRAAISAPPNRDVVVDPREARSATTVHDVDVTRFFRPPPPIAPVPPAATSCFTQLRSPGRWSVTSDGCGEIDASRDTAVISGTWVRIGRTIEALKTGSIGALSGTGVGTGVGAGVGTGVGAGVTSRSAAAAASRVVLEWRAAETGATPTTYVIEAGSAPGLADVANFRTNNVDTRYSAFVDGPGVWYVRVRAANAESVSEPSNEVVVRIGTVAATVPAAPANLTATVAGSTVILTWQAPARGGAPTAYIIQAGSVASASDLANFSVGSVTRYTATGVGPGTYFVRVLAFNSAGASPASNEIAVTVGGTACGAPPAAPSFGSVNVTGSTVTLSWLPGDGNATSFVVEAGSAPARADLATFDTGSPAATLTVTGVGAGTYYVRLRARNACGVSGPSRETTVIVR
jgi:hypothetical protein